MQLKALGTPFVCGALSAPAIILLHEAGHYASARLLDYSAEFSYTAVNFIAHEKLTKGKEVFTTASGPAVELALVAGGLFWLSRLRAHRGSTAASLSDWAATSCCALSAGRWLRCFSGTPADPQPTDEALLSQAAGLPSWFLPYALAPFAIAFIARASSYHPSGMRFIPFSSLFIGCVAGMLLWLFVVGPVLLPQP